jgi:hypothetical protein
MSNIANLGETQGKETVVGSLWLEHLQKLAVRFDCLGIGNGLTGLSIIELWGLYRYLTNLAAH